MPEAEKSSAVAIELEYVPSNVLNRADLATSDRLMIFCRIWLCPPESFKRIFRRRNLEIDSDAQRLPIHLVEHLLMRLSSTIPYGHDRQPTQQFNIASIAFEMATCTRSSRPQAFGKFSTRTKVLPSLKKGMRSLSMVYASYHVQDHSTVQASADVSHSQDETGVCR